ncbi:hypothetical protein SORBI_3003G443900 [Sorghum bicolor]|uniref:Uncharacterized protein n=1 Tax=Sorghum bicolor TaxID=4558 RepID=A0A1B6Q8I3_SORBI|nr:hypothetical protein SORBI_3003G443900 [Sorghum bicolor]
MCMCGNLDDAALEIKGYRSISDQLAVLYISPAFWVILRVLRSFPGKKKRLKEKHQCDGCMHRRARSIQVRSGLGRPGLSSADTKSCYLLHVAPLPLTFALSILINCKWLLCIF